MMDWSWVRIRGNGGAGRGLTNQTRRGKKVSLEKARKCGCNKPAILVKLTPAPTTSASFSPSY
jgi:hypothetical protein